MDARLRARVLAELSPAQQEAYECFERAFGIDLLTTDQRARTVVENAFMAALITAYRERGYSGLDAAYLAGDIIGLSPAAARTRYYGSILPLTVDRAA